MYFSYWSEDFPSRTENFFYKAGDFRNTDNHITSSEEKINTAHIQNF